MSGSLWVWVVVWLVVLGLVGVGSGGCVGLVSSGESSEESAFLDASESGGDVFFLTTAKLVPEDFDTSYDVYDAHECSGVAPCFPVPLAAPPVCDNGDSCKAGPSPQPEVFGAPSSATFAGVGNPPVASAPAAAVVVKKPLTRAQKLTAALKTCRKDKARKKRVACEKQARKKYGAKAHWALLPTQAWPGPDSRRCAEAVHESEIDPRPTRSRRCKKPKWSIGRVTS
jgi:hypothetical protein